MRLSIVEGGFELGFPFPTILIGFSPFQAIVGLVFMAQCQTWIHTEKIEKPGWLDKILNRHLSIEYIMVLTENI